MKRATVYIWLSLLGACLLCLISLRCGPGDEVAGGSGAGNPEGEVSFTLKATSSSLDSQTVTSKKVSGVSGVVPDTLFTIRDMSQTPFTITEVRIHVSRIDFDFPESTTCEGSGFMFHSPVVCYDNKIVINGPYVFDLMQGSAIPTIGTFKIPVGLYNGVNVRLEDLDPKDSTVIHDDALVDNTMFIKGVFNYAGKKDLSFSVKLHYDEIARFISPQGISVTDPSVTNIIVALDVDSWFSNVNIIGCLASNDIALNAKNELHIHEHVARNGCLDLEQKIKLSVKNSGSLIEERKSAQ